MIKQFFHWRFVKRYVNLIIFVLIVYGITRAGFRSRSERGTGYKSSNRRDSYPLSAFKWIANRQEYSLRSATDSRKTAFNLLSWRKKNNKISETEENLLMNFGNIPLDKKCKYMIDAIYLASNQWNNSFITKFYGNERVDDMLISLLGERLRIFDYCFISGGLEISNVMNLHSVVSKDKIGSPGNFMRRMFPFLRQQNELMWPKLINLNQRINPQQSFIPEDVSMNNFWNKWIGSSNGRGIAMTFDPSELTLFQKQLRTLSKLNNTLPIQIITSGFEFSDIQIEELSQYVTGTNQVVTLIDCGPILVREFAQQYIIGFANKWLAALFNTFEEVLLVDVDTVPFIDVEQFFEEPQYRSTGMALFKDRMIMSARTYKYCPESFRRLEPSYQENRLIGTRLLIESLENESPRSEAALLYDDFFNNGIIHHVDSGLVPIKKTANFNGLLFSFMINLDTKLRGCVHGDKEFFWLGQLYAGLNYTIYPQDAGVIGFFEELPTEELSQKLYMICGSQMAHVFYSSTGDSNKLAWTNGGLGLCKLSNAAQIDFQRLPDYFAERYGTVENLERFYAAPLHIQSILIPDSRTTPWLQLRECNDNLFCASAIEDTADGRNNAGTLIEFSPEEQNFLDSISFAWNGRTFTD